MGADMADQWYFARGKEKFGPFTAAKLKELAAQGRLLPTDMLHKEGMPKWVPASSVKGLFAANSVVKSPPALPTASPPATSPPARQEAKPSTSAPAAPAVVSGAAALLGSVKSLFSRKPPEPKAQVVSPVPVSVVPASQSQAATLTLAEVQATYRGGHPDFPDVATGVLRLEERGLSFVTQEATPRTIRLLYETVADILEPQTGAFPEEMVRQSQTTQTAAQAGKFAAGVAGSLIGGFGGKVVKAVGKNAAQTVKAGAALGAPPKNRLRVLTLLNGVPHRITFDVLDKTKDEMEAKAQTLWNQTARVRSRFTTPPPSAQLAVEGGSSESKLLELLKLIKELCDEGILKPAESKRMRGAVFHNNIGKLLAKKLSASLVGDDLSLLGDDGYLDEDMDEDEAEDADDDDDGDEDDADDDRDDDDDDDDDE
jgi:hypothetical protein